MNFHTHIAHSEAIININAGSNNTIDDNMYYSIGIHPWDSENVTSKAKEELTKLASLHCVVALGECGLDSLRGADLDTQQELFCFHANLAELAGKPLIIHCVHRFQEIISLKDKIKPEQAWIIHGFRGKPELLSQLIAKGFYISYGQKYNIDSAIATPVDKIFVESDDADVDINDIYSAIAKHKSIDINSFYNAVEHNYKAIGIVL